MAKPNLISWKEKQNHHDGAAPKPADFELGSLESRAAARALMGRRKSEETAIQVVYVHPDGMRTNGPLLRIPHVDLTPRQEADLRERLQRAEERMKK